MHVSSLFQFAARPSTHKSCQTFPDTELIWRWVILILLSLSLDSLDERRHQLKFIFKKNSYVFGAAFHLQENAMWSLWKYSWGEGLELLPLASNHCL